MRPADPRRLCPGTADAEVVLAVRDRDRLLGGVERDRDELPVALVELPDGRPRPAVAPVVDGVEGPVLQDGGDRAGGRRGRDPDTSVDCEGAPGRRSDAAEVAGIQIDL